MITLHIPRNLLPTLFRTATGTTARIRKSPVSSLQRTDGMASFLADRIALRKALALCTGCATVKMPRNWQKRYDYDELTAFHAQCACDYCRQEGPVSVFLAGEGAVWREREEAERAAREVKARQQALYEKDRRYVITI